MTTTACDKDQTHHTYDEPLLTCLEIKDLRRLVIQYLPTVFIDAQLQTGQYCLTIDHTQKIIDECQLVRSLYNYLQPFTTHSDDPTTLIVFHDHLKSRLFILIDSGCTFYDLLNGLWVKKVAVTPNTLLSSAFALPFDLRNVAITEFSRPDFRRQYKYIAGMIMESSAGFQLYTKWHWVYNNELKSERTYDVIA